MNALEAIARRTVGRYADAGDLTLGDIAQLMSIDGPMFIGSSTLRGDEELPPATLQYMASVFGRNSVVFAAFLTRWKLFAQARYQFQQMFGGRAGGLFGTPDLLPLEHPEPGETTLDLNFRAIQYADLAGDWFGLRRPAGEVRLAGPRLPFGDVDRIKPLRPDWTVIALGSRRRQDPMELAMDPDAEILGFGYTPGGPASGHDVISYGREEVAHFHPNTSPLSRYRGLPLILSALPEILADTGAVGYKRAYFRNAATPNLAVGFPPAWDEDKARQWIRTFSKKHQGAGNAFKTMYLGGGMTIEAIGNNFKDMVFKDLASSAETRIAAVIGMHPVIIPLSEGLAGSALNAGNYGSAKRSTSDITLRYLWPNMCGSLETIVSPPTGTRLWYDERAVPFLHADVTDQATVMQANAETIGRLVNEGFEPASVVDAVTSGDMNRLVHTGLVSVQLQAPGVQIPSKGDSSAAKVHHVSRTRLRALLAQGFTAATAGDEETIRDALARGPASASRRARLTFWPADGPIADEVGAGSILAGNHPTVVAYPSLFEPIPDESHEAKAGPALLVSRETVVAKRNELRTAGRSSGYDALARDLGVSRETIRRRLAEPQGDS